MCVAGNENRVPIGILEVQVELFPKLSVLLQVLRTSDEIVCVLQVMRTSDEIVCVCCRY